MSTVAREVLSVFKLRIGVAIALSAVAGLAVAPGAALPAWKIAALALGILLSAASAGAFNQYAERDLDARMPRTKTRPFVTGEFRAGPLWLAAIVAILFLAVALTGFVLNAWVALYAFLGAFVYGVVYTVWLKRRTWLNIVVGGLSGSFAVLAGGAAADPALSATPIILAIVLFLWTPPHFWSLAMYLHREYAAAKVPMLPVVVGDARASWVILGHTVAVFLSSLAPAFFGMGWLYLVCAFGGGVLFLWRSIELVRQPGPARAIANFHASLIQLGLLLLGAIADGWIGA
ncbi:MAG: heme o synthase [Alphaproteobacteria bacterium]|nr:heme o synthase [Alphaproteobacteria bacterium]